MVDRLVVVAGVDGAVGTDRAMQSLTGSDKPSGHRTVHTNVKSTSGTALIGIVVVVP